MAFLSRDAFLKSTWELNCFGWKTASLLKTRYPWLSSPVLWDWLRKVLRDDGQSVFGMKRRSYNLRRPTSCNMVIQYKDGRFQVSLCWQDCKAYINFCHQGCSCAFFVAMTSLGQYNLKLSMQQLGSSAKTIRAQAKASSELAKDSSLFWKNWLKYKIDRPRQSKQRQRGPQKENPVRRRMPRSKSQGGEQQFHRI